MTTSRKTIAAKKRSKAHTPPQRIRKESLQIVKKPGGGVTYAKTCSSGRKDRACRAVKWEISEHPGLHQHFNIDDFRALYKRVRDVRASIADSMVNLPKHGSLPEGAQAPAMFEVPDSGTLIADLLAQVGSADAYKACTLHFTAASACDRHADAHRCPACWPACASLLGAAPAVQVGAGAMYTGLNPRLFICLRRSNLGQLAVSRGLDLNAITSAAHDPRTTWVAGTPCAVLERVDDNGDAVQDFRPEEGGHHNRCHAPCVQSAPCQL
jgi:hypothetical protein